jgi:hypothetical protein
MGFSVILLPVGRVVVLMHEPTASVNTARPGRPGNRGGGSGITAGSAVGARVVTGQETALSDPESTMSFKANADRRHHISK